MGSITVVESVTASELLSVLVPQLLVKTYFLNFVIEENTVQSLIEPDHILLVKK